MHHAVICSCCARKFSKGVTRVLKAIVFNFCAKCMTTRRAECDSFMEKTAA